jgi:hypothetical protein
VQDEEEVGTTGGSIFGGLFAAKQSASLATVAEKNLGGAAFLFYAHLLSLFLSAS